MANTSIKNRLPAMSNKSDTKELRPLLNAILTDMTAMKTAIDAMATKLNADAGVTDTDYASADALTLNT